MKLTQMCALTTCTAGFTYDAITNVVVWFFCRGIDYLKIINGPSLRGHLCG